MSTPRSKPPENRLAGAARRAAERARRGAEQPEPSLAARLGQIGMLGWTIVVPTLIGVVIGRWIDRALGTGITFSAALIMAGAGIGLWGAWKWMHSS